MSSKIKARRIKMLRKTPPLATYDSLQRTSLQLV
jgi:hypothetical protein